MNGSDIVQSFYDNMATRYDRLFQDWQASMTDHAAFLDQVFAAEGFRRDARVLDCACGIGTQCIGLAKLGYPVTASDLSTGELAEAKSRAEANGVSVRFEQANFCALDRVFAGQFDILIAMDNALPHMLTREDLARAVRSMADRVRPGGLLVASIRDYDRLLEEKPGHSAPYIHKTDRGQRVSFQTWDWAGENYRFVQYIIEDEGDLQISKFECEYRATRRRELSELLAASGMAEASWKLPEDTGFYQPVVVARKDGCKMPADVI